MEGNLAVLSFAPIVLIGLVMVLLGVRARQKAQAATRWLCTEGQGLSVDVVRTVSHSKYGNTTWYVPKLEYGYTVGGARYTSHQIAFGNTAFKSEAQARSYLQDHFEGRPLTVHYDPGKPKNAVLLPGEAPHTLGLIVGGVVIMVFPILVGLVLFARR
ncbi:MAG: DUF3592 domain-containing protein [Anaerolineae bacterium]